MNIVYPKSIEFGLSPGEACLCSEGDKHTVIRRKDILCVGEVSTEDGPWIDDFYIAVAISGPEWYFISESLPGYGQFVAFLESEFSKSFDFSLKGQTVFDSNILYSSAGKTGRFLDLKPVSSSSLPRFLNGLFRIGREMKIVEKEGFSLIPVQNHEQASNG